jgi:hypothetical protein
VSHDAPRIVHVPARLHFQQIDTRNARLDRVRSRGDQQPVVGEARTVSRMLLAPV